MELPTQPIWPIPKVEVRIRKRSVKLPENLSPALAYLIGILRDGTMTKSLRSHKVAIYQKNKEFLENVINPLSVILFNKSAKILPSAEDYMWRLDSKPLYTFISKIFDYPKEGRQIFWRVPEIIRNAPKEIQRFYIAGFVDAEGSINIERNKPVIYIYQSWNNNLQCPTLEDLKQMLKNFGIHVIGPDCYRKSKNAFRLRLTDKNVKLFFEQIPLQLKFKSFWSSAKRT